MFMLATKAMYAGLKVEGVFFGMMQHSNEMVSDSTHSYSARPLDVAVELRSSPTAVCVKPRIENTEFLQHSGIEIGLLALLASIRNANSEVIDVGRQVPDWAVSG
jgi:hypothetical protein